MRAIMRLMVALAALAATSAGVGAANAGSSDNPNETGYWEKIYPGMTCYKDSWPGQLSANGYAVSLENGVGKVLIVNGGSGNAVYENTVVGVDYYPPLNAGGQHPLVSHWIVCKGTIVETTTTTAQATTTTEAATTTTAPATTTTDPATTTTQPEVTTTQPATTVPATTAPPTTAARSTPSTASPTTQPATFVADSTGELPQTGAAPYWPYTIAIGFVFITVGTLFATRRRA